MKGTTLPCAAFAATAAATAPSPPLSVRRSVWQSVRVAFGAAKAKANAAAAGGILQSVGRAAKIWQLPTSAPTANRLCIFLSFHRRRRTTSV